MHAAENRVILLVEDKRDDADLTLMALAESQVKNPVVHVKDGAEAIDYIMRRGKHAQLEAAPITLVLLDLNLPKVGGLDVLRRIRENAESRMIPVVILTTSKEEEDLARGYALGANSYIQKPIDFTRFSETVKQLSMYWLVLNECPPTPRKGGSQ